MQTKTIGILGRGKYGNWMTRFFESQGYTVISAGRNTVPSSVDVVKQADVIFIAVDLTATVDLIKELRSFGRSDQLWVSLASLMSEPVEALLDSPFEVAAVHPMFAPPSDLVWRNKAVLVSYARCTEWKAWLETVLNTTHASIRLIEYQKHDKIMAFIQGQTHAQHLIRAKLLQELGMNSEKNSRLASSTYLVDQIVTGRILSNDPELNWGILQMNPHTPAILDQIAKEALTLKGYIENNASEEFVNYFETAKEHYGETMLDFANQQFEEINSLLHTTNQENYE